MIFYKKIWKVIMKKIFLSAATAVFTVSMAGAAMACYKQNATYSNGSVGIKCSNGKQTTIYTSGSYQIGGTGYKYRTLAAAAKAACGC